MGDVLRCLELRSQGRTREHKYLKSHKSVLHMLEDAAATPSHNQPCEFSGEPRATFLMDFSISKLRVASTHGDHTVRVSDVRTGKCTHILTGHPRTPWCLAFSPVSDDILASGCLAGEIRIWDLMGGGSESLRNPCRGQVVTSLAFHPGGKVLVFATLNYIYFWDWSKDTPFAFTKTTHESERIRWLRFDPFGHYLYTGIGNLTSFHRDVIGAEMQVSSGMDDGGESSDTSEERVSQHLLNRARYQRLLERFMAFQQDRTRQREAPDIPRPPEASDGLHSTRRLFDQAVNLCQRSREIFQRLAPSVTRQRLHGTDTDFRERNSLPQRQGPDQPPCPSQTAGSEGLAHDDNRLGRRTLDSDWLFRSRQDELQSRQRWGRYEPTFFTRSDSGSSRVDSVDRGSLNYSMPLRQFRHRGQSLDPYPRTSLQPPSLAESAGPSGVSCLVFDTPAHVGQALREGNAASESLDTNEFEIIPVNQTERSRYGMSRSRHAATVSRNETSHRPCFIQQREELQALLSRYVNRSGDESSASSEAAAVPPPQTSLACVSSAASTGDCNETDVKSSTTQPLLAEAASARSLPEQQTVAREVGSTECYSAVSSSVNHSCACFSPLNGAHNSVSSSAHTTSSHEGTSGMLDTVENNKPPSAGPEESSDVPVMPETVKQNESGSFRVYRCDVNPANETAGSSTDAAAQSSLHSECTEATVVKEKETSEHNSTSEDKSEKPIIPECHFSYFRRMTPVNNTDHDSSQSVLNDVNDNWIDRCTRSNSVPLSQAGSSLATNTLECDHSCSAHAATSRTSGPENNNLLSDGEVASRQESSSELSSARLRRYTTTLRRSIRNEQSPYEFWKRRHASVSSNLQPASHEGTLRRSNRLLNFSEAAQVGVDQMENLTSHSRLASDSRIHDSRHRSLLARSTEDITSRVNASSQSDQAVGQSEPVVGNERLSESYSSRVFEGVPRYTHRLDYRNRHLRHETTSTSSQASSTRSSVSFGLNQGQSWGRRSAFGSHSWGLYEGSEYRHHISAFHDRQFPRPVSDQTSQTLGAMNLPASSDQCTDVAGLNDMPVNYMQAAGVLGSPHVGQASTAGFDQRQHLSFSNRTHTNLSIVPTGMRDRIHMDESSSSQAGRSVADMMETERYQSIQSYVRNVRNYLAEDSGDSSIEENMNEESSEASADGVLDGQGSRTYSIDSGAGGSRSHGRYLGNSSFLAASMRENNQPLESVSNRNNNAWRQESNLPHTSVYISSSSQLPGMQPGADCSPVSPVFHRISTPTNSAPCSYAPSQVTSLLPAASPTRSAQPAADEDSFASEPDGFQITDPHSRGILASDMGYRSLRNSANYEHPVRFHPYASVFQRGGSIFRHGDGSSLPNRYTSVMGVPSRATASVSSSSSNSILENSLSHNLATSVPLTYSGISNRLRRDSDSDQPSAFSIFDTSERDPVRHSSTYYRSSSSLLNPTSAYSLLNPTSTNSLLNPSSTNSSPVSSPYPRGLRAHAETSSRSTSSIHPPGHIPDPESEGFALRNIENLPGGAGDLGGRQQASTGDVAWRTPSLSLVNQASVTEYLERRVMELDRRLSDLEQSYNSQLRQLQVECQWHRRAQNSTDHLPTRLRGVGVGPLHDPIDSVLFPRAETSAQANSNDGAAPVPFRQLLECLRRQDPNPHVRVSEADLPTSVTISQARDEVNSDEVPEAGSSSGRRRPWHSLRQIHLHPDYSRSILDDTINGPSETQRAMNRNLGGAFLYSEYDMGIAGNIVVQTHRIQQWDISNIAVPDISDASANIIVRHCRLHNDASCDLSQDGTLLATIVPSYCGFADTNIVALFSLRRQTFAQCLYTKSFGPNAISVSISPLNRYILVGLASRRTIFVTSVQLVGQVFRLVKEKAGESSMKHHKDIYHAFEDDRGTTNVSVNSARWLPGVGEGLVYGTNRGDLHFFRAGSRKVHDQEFPSGQQFQSRGEFAASRQRNTARNSIATQTTTVSIRRSASTQTSTESPDGEEINNVDDVHSNSMFES